MLIDLEVFNAGCDYHDFAIRECRVIYRNREISSGIEQINQLTRSQKAKDKMWICW